MIKNLLISRRLEKTRYTITGPPISKPWKPSRKHSSNIEDWRRKDITIRPPASEPWKPPVKTSSNAADWREKI